MNHDQIALARRAMALPGWEWRGGMLAHDLRHPTYSLRVVGNGEASAGLGPTSGLTDDYPPDSDGVYENQSRFVIHLVDPTSATDGVLLRLLGPG